MSCRLALLVALVAAATLAPTVAQSRPWTLSDAVSVEEISDVRISPDGALALIQVVQPDVAANSLGIDYRLVRIADGKTSAIAQNLSQPRWAPNGGAIAWLRASQDGSNQLVLTNAKGTAPYALTHTSRSIVAFAWSHDGKRIAAVETAGNPKTANSRIRWMTAESDFSDATPPKRDVYILDAATGAEQALTNDSWSYGGPATDHDPSWSADDNQIAVVRQPTPVYGDFEHVQYVTVNTRDGSTRQIVDGPFFAYPESVPPMFAPSGGAIAYTHTWDGQLASREDLYVDNLDVTASLDRDLWSCASGAAEWQPHMLVVSLMDGVSVRLYRIDENSGVPQVLTSADGSVEAFSTASDGRIAFAWNTPSAPSELYVLDPGGAPRQVTHIGALHGLSVATTRYFKWKARDGHIMHGQLTVPNGAQLSSVPIVMEPHGGPQCAFDSSLNGLAQFLATNGYAFFRPDPRGSDGYGDWSYKALVDNWGEGPTSDDLTGVDAVIASGVGNADHLYIEGASYGGYLASWIVTHSDRFKAAVAMVPVTNMLLDYTLSLSPNVTRRFFGPKPAVDQALLSRESPLSYAANEHTPMLVIIGLRDTRAPYPQAIEFYKTVAENGGETQLLADTQSGHGPDDPQGVMLWFRATLAWLVQHGAPPLPGAAMPK